MTHYDTPKDVAGLKAYLKSRGFKYGNGQVMSKVMRAITHGTDEDVKMLNKVLADERQASALFELMFDDLSGKTKKRAKKVRRGIGSY